MGKHKLAKPAELKPVKKHLKKSAVAAIIAGSIILALAVAWFTTCAVSAYKLLNPERKKLVQTDGPMELDMVYSTLELKGANDGDQLICWWIPSQDYEGEIKDSTKTVVFSHNYGSNREMTEISLLYIAKYLVHNGYNVVTFDYSGSGNAKGSNYTFGAQEKDELMIVADYFRESYGQTDVAVMGFGFGAAAAILAGCGDDGISCVIADSSYLDLGDYLENNLSVWTGLPDFPFSPMIKALLPLFSDYPIYDVSPYDAVKSAAGKSFLFIHCTQDSVFPYENSNLLYQAASANNFADVVLFNTLHIYGFMDYEDNYMSEVLNFLSEHLGAEAAAE